VDVLKTDTVLNCALAALNPFIHFIATEEIELKDIKAIGNLKKLCDGNLHLTPYRKSAAIHIHIKQLIMTSNSFMDFGGATGVARRVLYYKYLKEFVKTPEEANAAEFKFLANPDLSETSLENATAEKKSHFFNWFAQGTTCYLNRYDDNFIVPVCNAFVLGKHVPNINSMLTNYVTCEGGTVSVLDMFNEYVDHCNGFQTLNKDQFKAKMISLHIEYGKNARTPDNTIGCFQNILSIRDYTYKIDRMQDAISELGGDIMECNSVEYDRRYNKRQYELERFERFKDDNGKPIVPHYSLSRI
jgi:hypothetical protein